VNNVKAGWRSDKKRRFRETKYKKFRKQKMKKKSLHIKSIAKMMANFQMGFAIIKPLKWYFKYPSFLLEKKKR
jgi:hypothetical protein